MTLRQPLRLAGRIGTVLVAALALAAVSTVPANAADTDARADNRLAARAGATAKAAPTAEIAARLGGLPPAMEKGAGPVRGDVRVATACFGEILPVIKVDSSTVRLTLAVLCDQPIVNIAIQAGIFRGNDLVGDVQFYNLFGIGAVVSFDRPCVNGDLFGAMVATVAFASGSPPVISAFFQGPTVPITC